MLTFPPVQRRILAFVKLGCRGEEDGRGRGQVRGALDAKGKGWRRMDRG